MFKNKGSILVVTIVAMMIMMIIGIVCLQMFYVQNILSTYDQVKIRTRYSAEGAIDLMRGYIDYIIENNSASRVDGDTFNGATRGYLFEKTSTTVGWKPLNTSETNIFLDEKNKVVPFDGTMYPMVFVDVSCIRLDKNALTTFSKKYPYIYGSLPYNATINWSMLINSLNNKSSDYGEQCMYKIVAIASATYKTNLNISTVSTTIEYYFGTRHDAYDIPGQIYKKHTHKRYFICAQYLS